MKSHLIILSTGREDGGQKAALAFGIGAAALSAGDAATIYLAASAICWAYQPCIDGVETRGELSMSEQVSLFRELGGKVLVCSRCVTNQCSTGLCLSDSDLVPGVEFGGLTTLVELACDSVVYSF